MKKPKPNPERKKNPVGRPAHVPTDTNRARVLDLAAFGIPHAQIAGRLKICVDTLKAHYEEQLSKGHTEANEQVLKTLFSQIVDKHNVTAMIFWAKTRCGYSTTRGHVNSNDLTEMANKKDEATLAEEAAEEEAKKAAEAEQAAKEKEVPYHLRPLPFEVIVSSTQPPARE